MKATDLLWDGLLRKPLRSGLLFIAAFACFQILGGLLAGHGLINNALAKAADDLLIVTNRIGIIRPLPLAAYDEVRGMQEVGYVSHQSIVVGTAGTKRTLVPMLAVDPASFFTVRGDLAVESAAKARFGSERRAALVGERIANSLGWNVGDLVTVNTVGALQPIGQRDWTFMVAGLIGTGSDGEEPGFLLFRYDYLNEARRFGGNQTDMLLVRVPDAQRADAVAARIDSHFENSPYPTNSVPERELGRALLGQVANFGAALLLVGGAACAMITLVVGNALSMSIREREREFGILKAIGLPDRWLLGLVFGEAAAILLPAAFLGFGVVTVATFVVGRIGGGSLPTTHLTLASWGLGLLAALALTLICSIVPAFHVLRASPTGALRRD